MGQVMDNRKSEHLFVSSVMYYLPYRSEARTWAFGSLTYLGRGLETQRRHRQKDSHKQEAKRYSNVVVRKPEIQCIQHGICEGEAGCWRR